MTRTNKIILACLLSGMMISGMTDCIEIEPDSSIGNTKEQAPKIASTQASTITASDQPLVTTTSTTHSVSATKPLTTTNAPITTTPTPSEYTYILNTSTKKFHFKGCHSVNKIADKNKDAFIGSRSEIIAQGYDPCEIAIHDRTVGNDMAKKATDCSVAFCFLLIEISLPKIPRMPCCTKSQCPLKSQSSSSESKAFSPV